MKEGSPGGGPSLSRVPKNAPHHHDVGRSDMNHTYEKNDTMKRKKYGPLKP